MSKIIVDVALANLLEIGGSGAKGVREREDGGASGRSLVQRMIAAAARFLDTLDGAGEGGHLRVRAGLMARETAAGTPYDESRREFIRLFGPPEELPLPPPGEDFGDLRDQRHSYVCFPSALRIVMSQTLDYMSLVPTLKATCAFESNLADVPNPLEGSAPKSSQGEEHVAESEPSLPTPAGCPTIIAEAWYAQLHRLELLAERELFWGCHLIQLCHEAGQPESGDFATTAWLREQLERQHEEVLQAILTAAAMTVSGGGNGNNRQSKSEPQTWHSEDFRYVIWFGTEYHFTRTQALCVECLWRAWEKKLPGVSKNDLIKACETSGSEIKDVFKGCEAWQKMIVSPNRGFYRLQPPTEAK